MDALCRLSGTQAERNLKTVDRYVLKELIVPFLIGTLSVVLMFQANMLIFQLKTFSISAVPPEALMKLIIQKTPYFLNMTLPVGMSLAASLAISRLTRESELTAIRSAGARILRVCMPIMGFGIFVALGNFMLVERVMPKTEAEARQLQTQLAILGAAPEFKSNVVINLRNYAANIGSVSSAKDNTLQLNRILLFERPRVGEVVVISAETGTYRDGIWNIPGAIVWHVTGSTLTKMETGKDVMINEPTTVENFFATPQAEEQTAEQLLKAIDEGKRAGWDTTRLQVAYHVRFAIPASCIIFALVAPVFAVWFARSGGFFGVLLSIILVFLYYNAHIISTEILGRNGWVSPWLAAWLPNLIFVAFGVLGIRRLE